MTIAEDQNLPDNIKLRRAISQAYFNAKCSLAGQLLATVILPVAISIISSFQPGARPYAAIFALMALGADTFWLDRRQKSTLRTAAKIAERFDCNVLRMTWNNAICGQGVQTRDITQLDSQYRERKKSDERLLDWYPIDASRAAHHKARIICQLTNAQYDGRLRWRYRFAVMSIMVAALLGMTALGIYAQLSLTDFVVVVLVPATPLVGWTLREYFRQLDADKPLESIEEHALELWADARSHSNSIEEIERRSRALQDAIYLHRSRAPLPVPFLYSIFRNTLEKKMNSSATDRINEIEL